MADANITAKVECRGGVFVEARVSRLKRVSPYFESLFSDRWGTDNNNNKTIKLLEVTAEFLTRQLEKLDDDQHQLTELDQADFLNIKLDDDDDDNLAPPLPMHGRTNVLFYQELPSSADIFSNFMIHIDRKLIELESSWRWDQVLITIWAGTTYFDVTFNEAWVMALQMRPEQIKLYSDRIDLPIFPDLVMININKRGGRNKFYSNYSQYTSVTARPDYANTPLRQKLAYDKQQTPFSVPSKSSTALKFFVSGENLKMEDIKIEANSTWMYEIKPLVTHLENPFDDTVRTFIVQTRQLDSVGFLALFPDVGAAVSTLNIPASTPRELALEKNEQRFYKGSFSWPTTAIVWSIMDIRLMYAGGVFGPMYIP